MPAKGLAQFLLNDFLDDIADNRHMPEEADIFFVDPWGNGFLIDFLYNERYRDDEVGLYLL